MIRVRCIEGDARDRDLHGISLGHVYSATVERLWGSDFYRILNDAGVSMPVFQHRFEVVKAPPTQDVPGYDRFDRPIPEPAPPEAAIGVAWAAPAPDPIARPAHYARFPIEPLTFIMANKLPYWTGNVVKYVCRAPHKHVDEGEDIRKAIRYCEMRLQEIEREKAGTAADVVGKPL